MKNLILLTILLLFVIAKSNAQLRIEDDKKDPKQPPITIDINILFGVTSNNIQTNFNSIYNYPNAINPFIPSPIVSSGGSFGLQVGLGHYLKLNENWGYGILLLDENSSTTINNSLFEVQFQSTDYLKRTFRQIITATNPFSEKVNLNSISIPLLIKTRRVITNNAILELELGPIIHLLSFHSFTTSAIFNYEAIYSFNSNGTATFDNGIQPAPADIYYTHDSLQKYHPTTYNKIFDSLKNLGYNVGLNVKPNKNNGLILAGDFSLGFYIHPQVVLHKDHKMNYKIGAYFSYLPIHNSVKNNYQLTNKLGDYNSLLNNVAIDRQVSIGLSFGLSINFQAKINPDGINF